jgi:PIN domain nuclease of toxin-antitoxin system
MGRKQVILLDTHVLLWMNQDDAVLGKAARRHIQTAWDAQVLAVSAISFRECEMLHGAKRVRLPQSPAAWRAQLLAAGLIEFPVDGEIAMLSVHLDLPHNDPADRLIAATAIVKAAELMTADTKLLKWKSTLKRHDASR